MPEERPCACPSFAPGGLTGVINLVNIPPILRSNGMHVPKVLYFVQRKNLNYVTCCVLHGDFRVPSGAPGNSLPPALAVGRGEENQTWVLRKSSQCS